MPEFSAVSGGRILFGGDYNPEQWPREVWQQDVALMRQAGVNCATVGVFSWARIEPQPGVRDFAWLDEVLDLLHANGISVILATPTASPPPWLGHRHPDALAVTRQGVRYGNGSRNHFDPSSPVYREHALAIVEDIAARYAHHPALAMWHVGNEYCEHSWSDASDAHFRRWLQARYGEGPDGLAALNHAWGTTFWSQIYGQWEEVRGLHALPYVPNPAQDLDYQRFCSDALLECYLAEVDVLRGHNPDVPVTTNFMPLFKPVDGWAFGRNEDFTSVDSYPDPADPDSMVEHALLCDLTRSQGAGKPWILMEQAPSSVDWRDVNKAKRPGQQRLHSYQALARGAGGVCFFQWRSSASGAESLHTGMVPHAGPDSRVHREISAVGAELATLGQLADDRVSADVAIVLEHDNWWALEKRSRPSREIRQLDLVKDWYQPLWRQHVTVDFAESTSDLDRYRLVVVPNAYLLTARAAANLTGFVARGGHLVVGFYSGVVDEHDRVHTGGFGAPLREVLGVRVEEFWPLAVDETLACTSDLLGDFEINLWTELLRGEGAQEIATIKGGDLDGIPTILRNRHGAGTAWYVSSRLDTTAQQNLLREILGDAAVAPVLDLVADRVEVVRRGDTLLLLNHGEDTVRVPLAAPHTDLLTGREHTESINLGHFDVAVLAPTP